MQKIIVQACCGPCSTAAAKNFEKCAFFFNGDNFDTQEEYDRRLNAMLKVDKDTAVMPYNPKIFNTCDECMRYRMSACAKYALEHGFDAFSTSLTVSPHKNTEEVNKIGREVGNEIGITFVEVNLKKNGGFMYSVAKSKELGLYRQNYCGCAKSVRQ